MKRLYKRVWIVEVMVTDGIERGWKPTTGMALTKVRGGAVLRMRRESNPGDRFRLVPYRA